MKELSIFEHFNKVVSNQSLDTIVEQIRTGKYKEPVEQLRLLLQQNNEKEYTVRKKSLPAFTPSGRFSGGRKPEFIQEYSRIIILDIDKLEDIDNVRYKAMFNHFTLCCFISPSGSGLKILVKTDNSITKHREAFLKVQSYYEKYLNVKIDPSGKDVTRLCFLSWDPEIHYNNDSETFKIETEMSIKSDIDKLIEQLDGKRLDITSNYDDWLKIGFAIESEFGQAGRSYFHDISRYNPDYSPENCNDQYDKCLKNNNSGITLKTLFHIAKQHGVTVKSLNQRIAPDVKTEKKKEQSKITSNKFVITEEYLAKNFDLRYNVVSNKFEYKKKGAKEWEEMNENNMYVHLQKNNINISQNNLLALLKSDFVKKHHVFKEYFEGLPVWDGKVDYIAHFISYLKTPEQERLAEQFKKWIVRAVRTAIDDKYYNKQAFVIVTQKQNVGKSRFLRYLCPDALSGYIIERLGTDKDSQVALTENFLVNLDELSTAQKADLNALKSMFSRDKVKARLSYDKRTSVHSRRASFIGSTDKWEFLTDENGSVRWLCFQVDDINWGYEQEVDIDKVYSQAYTLLQSEEFDYEMTRDEIRDNEHVNKRFQVSSPERDLIMKYFTPSVKEEVGSEFMTATDMLEYINDRTKINLSSRMMGKELKFLDFDRKSERLNSSMSVWGYWVMKNKK